MSAMVDQLVGPALSRKHPATVSPSGGGVWSWSTENTTAFSAAEAIVRVRYRPQMRTEVDCYYSLTCALITNSWRRRRRPSVSRSPSDVRPPQLLLGYAQNKWISRDSSFRAHVLSIPRKSRAPRRIRQEWVCLAARWPVMASLTYINGSSWN